MNSWRDSAACEKLPLEAKRWFFGEAGGLSSHRQHEYARMICYQCPVQVACIRYCIESDSGDDGVWGGLTFSQRKRYLLPLLRRKKMTDELLSEVIIQAGQNVLRKLARGEAPPIEPLIERLDEQPDIVDTVPHVVPVLVSIDTYDYTGSEPSRDAFCEPVVMPERILPYPDQYPNRAAASVG
jgi:hypothetical protein